MSEARRHRFRVPSIVRWLHLYLSLAGFATILFFALTGITLNHAALFESGGAREREIEDDIPPTLVAAAATPDRDALAAHLRAKHALKGEPVDFDVDAEMCSLVFKGPGYTADVSIDRAAARAVIRETQLGAVAVLDDLHKGRDTGRVWSLIIDLSAGLMAVSSLTGLWLLFYVRRRRAAGIVVTVVGSIVLTAIALLFVP